MKGGTVRGIGCKQQKHFIGSISGGFQNQKPGAWPGKWPEIKKSLMVENTGRSGHRAASQEATLDTCCWHCHAGLLVAQAPPGKRPKGPCPLLTSSPESQVRLIGGTRSHDRGPAGSLPSWESDSGGFTKVAWGSGAPVVPTATRSTQRALPHSNSGVSSWAGARDGSSISVWGFPQQMSTNWWLKIAGIYFTGLEAGSPESRSLWACSASDSWRGKSFLCPSAPGGGWPRPSSPAPFPLSTWPSCKDTGHWI